MIDVENTKPERDFRVDEQITLDDVKRKYELNEAITGHVLSFNLKEKIIRVSLGNSIVGILPFNEVCLEDLKFIEGTPAQVKTIYKKKIIRAKVTAIDGKNIYLSRKQNLLDVFTELKKRGLAFFNATIENAGKYNIFCDIAEGIIAYCSVEELSRVYIDDARDWVTIGNHIRVRITKYNDPESLVWCSAKKAAMGNYKIIKPRTKIMAKIGKPIKNENGMVTGYFVEITPAIAGIADVREDYGPKKEYKLGEMVECYVRNVDAKKHRVKLFLEN